MSGVWIPIQLNWHKFIPKSRRRLPLRVAFYLYGCPSLYLHNQNSVFLYVTRYHIKCFFKRRSMFHSILFLVIIFGHILDYPPYSHNKKKQIYVPLKIPRNYNLDRRTCNSSTATIITEKGLLSIKVIAQTAPEPKT